MWALTDNRKEKTYDEILEHVTSKFPDFQPQKFMSDYEIALRNSLRKFFPEAKILGCYFHYAQVKIQILVNDQ